MNRIAPYLNFDGNCREAMEFCQRCFGGELQVMTFAEGDFESPPEAKDRLLHAHLARGEMVLMASDTMPGMPFQPGNNIWLSVECESDMEVDSLYPKLLAGGREVMAPHDAF
jgi:PhnB protein